MTPQGYIKLWRKIGENPLWTGEKFTRGQAWVDLLMLANHKDGYIRKRGIKVVVRRGDMAWSESELAKRWRWSRGKVRRFLKELCSGNDPFLIPQNGQQNKNVTSLYKIVKYESYQGNGTTEQTSNGHQTDTKRYRNNNEKNEKNISTSVDIGAKAPSRAKAKAKIKTKTKQPAPPTLEQVKEYFLANGYPEETAERFFHCYENGNPPWHDTKGNPVLAWKQKAHSVWFKKENKNNTREKSAWERLQDSQLNQARMLRAIREREQQHEQTTSDNCKRVCAIEHGPADPDS